MSYAQLKSLSLLNASSVFIPGYGRINLKSDDLIEILKNYRLNNNLFEIGDYAISDELLFLKKIMIIEIQGDRVVGKNALGILSTVYVKSLRHV